MGRARTYRWLFPVILLVILAAGFGLRLPQLLGAHLMLDGDEALLGIMARRLREGREFPLFVHGQSFGLSLLEAGAAAATSSWLGDRHLALRIAAGALWFGGVVAWAVAARRAAGVWAGVAMAALLVTCPAWMAWSMKPRGGDVTAFLLLGLLFASLAARSPLDRAALPRSPWSLQSALPSGGRRGCLLGLLAFAQPLFALAALPVLALRIREENPAARVASAVNLLFFTAATCGALLLAGSLLRGPRAEWNPGLLGPFRPLEALARLPERLSVASRGQFLDLLPGTPEWPVRAIGWIWFGAAALVVLGSVVRGRDPWTRGVGLGVVLACAGSIGLGLGQLGYHSFLVVPLGVCWLLAMGGRRARATALVLVITGVALAPSFGRVSLAVAPGTDVAGGERAAFRALLTRLDEERIEHVYALDPMLQWCLIHDTEERVAARWLRSVDRYPEFTQRVDQALRSGSSVALVGPATDAIEPNTPLDRAQRAAPGAEHVANRYFILAEPDETTLREIGFRFRNAGSP